MQLKWRCSWTTSDSLTNALLLLNNNNMNNFIGVRVWYEWVQKDKSPSTMWRVTFIIFLGCPQSLTSDRECVACGTLLRLMMMWWGSCYCPPYAEEEWKKEKEMVRGNRNEREKIHKLHATKLEIWFSLTTSSAAATSVCHHQQQCSAGIPETVTGEYPKQCQNHKSGYGGGWHN